MEHKISVSIIIPAHNAGTDMAACLEALQNEELEGVEIIVVDDASTDETAAQAEAFGVEVVALENNRGPSAARNLGAAHARGEIFFFLDSDVVIHDGTVKRVRAFFERNESIAALFGSYDTKPHAGGLVTQYRNLVHHFVHQHGSEEASTFWAGCGAIRRSVFEEMNGFDEADYPRCIEDIELGYRLRRAGYGIHLDKGLLCTHSKRWTFLNTIRTDVFCRAIPWSRLNRNSDAPSQDLNIKTSQKISVVLVGAALLAACLSFVHTNFAAAALLIVVLILALNSGLFLFFLCERGFVFALFCIPLHLLYFFYSGLSYLYVYIASLLDLKIRDGNTKP